MNINEAMVETNEADDSADNPFEYIATLIKTLADYLQPLIDAIDTVFKAIYSDDTRWGNTNKKLMYKAVTSKSERKRKKYLGQLQKRLLKYLKNMGGCHKELKV